MIIDYKDRKVEITNFLYFNGNFNIETANYIDGNMEDLTSGEIEDLESNYQFELYNKMSVGTGY